MCARSLLLPISLRLSCLSVCFSLSLFSLPPPTTSFKLQKRSFSEQQAAMWCSHPINKALGTADVLGVGQQAWRRTCTLAGVSQEKLISFLWCLGCLFAAPSPDVVGADTSSSPESNHWAVSPRLPCQLSQEPALEALEHCEDQGGPGVSTAVQKQPGFCS